LHLGVRNQCFSRNKVNLVRPWVVAEMCVEGLTTSDCFFSRVALSSRHGIESY
jgi:hypothetical protein